MYYNNFCRRLHCLIYCFYFTRKLITFVYLFCYSMLLYFSLFGFTLEPRQYRTRYSTSKQFLSHLNLSGRYSNYLNDEDYDNFDLNHLILPVDPEVIRNETVLLVSDLLIRLKQLLFNSLTFAYYVGFIPIQFTPVSINN